MKASKFIAVALMVATALTASAQFTQTGSSTKKNTAKVGVNTASLTSDYNRISLSYDNLTFTGKKGYKETFNGESVMGTNGFGVDYIHGFSVSKKYPMFIETGLKMTATFSSIENDDYEDLVMKSQFLSLAIPVNFAYKVGINNNVTFVPYIGLNFKINCLGRSKAVLDDLDVDDDDEESDWWSYYSDDEDDGMGDDDLVWNRFQLGWHIGIGFNIKSFYIGAQYGTDFIPATKYKKNVINDGHFALNLGFNF